VVDLAMPGHGGPPDVGRTGPLGVAPPPRRSGGIRARAGAARDLGASRRDGHVERFGVVGGGVRVLCRVGMEHQAQGIDDVPPSFLARAALTQRTRHLRYRRDNPAVVTPLEDDAKLE